jgi:hypothetical protein
MLAEVYGFFTEGFETADLQEAAALLKHAKAATVVPFPARRTTG